MPVDLSHLEGKTFCVVFAKLNEEDPEAGPIQMKTIHGRANIPRKGELAIENENGKFNVPPSAHNRVMEGDGTPMLNGAQYFVILKVHGMDL